MDEYFEKVRTLLEQLLDRTDAAIEKLEAGDWEGGDEALRRQKAAFHNFQALDYRASRSGFDAARHPELQNLSQDIDQRSQMLSEVVKSSRQAIVEELAGLRKNRQALGLYRSGTLSKSRIEKTI